MIIRVFFCNEVTIKMLKILKMNRNLKRKLLAIKKKIAKMNHLRKNLNKNRLINLNKNKKLWQIKKANLQKK